MVIFRIFISFALTPFMDSQQSYCVFEAGRIFRSIEGKIVAVFFVIQGFPSFACNKELKTKKTDF